jgi:hypothetical protein
MNDALRAMYYNVNLNDIFELKLNDITYANYKIIDK